MNTERLTQFEFPGSFPTKALAVRRALEAHQSWIEQSLGVPLSETVIIEVEIDLTQIATERFLGIDESGSIRTTRTLRRLRSLVAEVDVPAQVPPVLEMDDALVKENLSNILGGRNRHRTPRMQWGDSPVALRFHLRGTVLVAVNVPYHDGPGATYPSTARVVIARRDHAREAIDMIAHIARKDQQPRIMVQDGPARRITPCDWDDLVLDPVILSQVRDDLRHFFQQRPWFRRNKLPFRRGLLCFGPPGNGKSSVIRAILTAHGLTAYTLPWLDPHKDDSDLQRLFEEAGRYCPSLILLEDIDRAFPKGGESRSNISLQQLLGCLDGISTPEGIVVVATANDPTILDPAILRRPGRFDRVVFFGPPKAELRLKYFLKFHAPDAIALQQVVAESDGFSYAQLREVCIIAAQYAYERHSDINPEDLVHGVRTLRQANLQASGGSSSTGFTSAR